MFRFFGKICSGAVIGIVSILILVIFEHNQQQEVDLNFIQAFDPTCYVYQYEPVEFELPIVHNRWVPVSKVLYSADGDILSWEKYSVDDSGALICTSKNGSVSYTPHTSKNFYLETIPSDAISTRYYYESQTAEDETHLCGYVCVRDYGNATDSEGTVSHAFGYEIISFGQYDYTSHLRVEHLRYIETDRTGQLKMLILKCAFGYWAYWFDEFGRKSWYAGYDFDGELYQYAKCEYQSIDTVHT